MIEGLIDPEKLEPEAPFGESNGYVALEAYNMPMQVTAITRKRAPVFASIISQVTPSESSVIKKVAYEPLFLSHLRDHLGDQGHPPRGHARAADQSAPRHLPAIRATARRAARSGAGCTAPPPCSPNCGKIVIAVSEDIDPASMDAVLWSLAYRTNPIEDVHLAPYRGGVQGAQYGPQDRNSGMLIDATRKYPMPPLALPTREYMEHARALWEELDLPSAQRAVALARLQARRLDRSLGDLCAPRRRRRLGADRRDTLARQRGGLTPEAPARFDKPDKPGKK